MKSTSAPSVPRTAAPKVQCAASYARKSDPNDFGIAAQHDMLAARARDDGFEIPDSADFRFEDDNTTGVATSRKGLDRLLERVRNHEVAFSRLYVKDKTRLGRFDDPRRLTWLEVELEQEGVTVCYWENENPQAALADPKNPNRFGAFMQDQVGNIIASEERRRLISRITCGMRDRVRKGFFPGALAPYGTEKWLADKTNGSLIQHVPSGMRLRRVGCFFRLKWAEDATRQVIQRIFGQIELGHSLRSIASALNRDGVPTPAQTRHARRQGQWSEEAVRRIARNPLYSGVLVWGRTTRAEFGEPLPVEESTADGEPAMRCEGFVVGDAPVSRETWSAVQQILDGNVGAAASRRASRPEYILSGLVSCALCGETYHGHSAAVGRAVRYYRHDPRHHGGRPPCKHDNAYIRAEVLERAALEHLRAVLSEDGLVTAVREEVARRRDRARSGRLDQQVRELERQLERHRNALDQAKYDRSFSTSAAGRDSSAAVIARLEAEIESYVTSLQELTRDAEIAQRAEARLEQLSAWTPERLDAALAAAPTERKRVLAMLLDGVVVSADTRSAELRIRPAA